jgi:hypothetical protein
VPLLAVRRPGHSGRAVSHSPRSTFFWSRGFCQCEPHRAPARLLLHFRMAFRRDLVG